MGNELLNVPLDKIRTNPIALRDVDRTREDFMQLVDSVKQYGVQNPIVLRRKAGEDGKEFELVDGLQRFTASQEASKPDIPAHVMEKSDADALTAQIIGNAHKIETKPVEYAKALLRILSQDAMMTQSQLAAKLNKGPAWLDKMLGLNKIHKELQPLVNEGKINVSNAFALSKFPPEEQLAWSERAQTLPSDQFAEQALARSREIKAANRKGADAEPEKFTPVAHLRKKPEIESELQGNAVALDLIRETNILEGVPKNSQGLTDAATKGFQLGLQWALNLDPRSVKEQEAKYEARRKSEAEAKIRRDAERSKKKEEEATKKAEEARKNAAEAAQRAAALPAEATPV